jgi:tRNA A37 threonylcarbamoyladenosine dehydratase
MRRELKKRKIDSCKVLYSTEKPLIVSQEPASIAFVPSVAGLLIAREVILDLLKESDSQK